MLTLFLSMAMSHIDVRFSMHPSAAPDKHDAVVTVISDDVTENKVYKSFVF